MYKTIFSLVLLVFSITSFGQTNIKVGFKTGVYFASKKSAIIYNGTGSNGISSRYSQAHLQNDINDELNFPYTLGEPPLDLKYEPAISLGGSIAFVSAGGDEFVIEGDICNLQTEGFYTVFLDDPSQLEQVIKAYPIIGKEKRLNIDLNYKSYFGDDDANFSPYFLTGANIMRTQFVSNQFYIGNLGPYGILPDGLITNNTGNSGIGIGGNIGLGGSYIVTANTAIDLEYKATYNSVNYGNQITFKGLHHMVSLRFNWVK